VRAGVTLYRVSVQSLSYINGGSEHKLLICAGQSGEGVAVANGDSQNCADLALTAGHLRQRVGSHLLAALQKEVFYADEGGCTPMYADYLGLNEVSGRVIGRAFTVLNTLGTGFLEKIHETSLAYEAQGGLERRKAMSLYGYHMMAR